MRTSFIFFALLSFGAEAQKAKIGFRGGASFANFINHNASGDKDVVIYYPLNIGNNVPTSQPQPQPQLGFTDYNPIYKTDLFNDMRVGFFSGLYVELNLNSRWKLEMEIDYTQKGINLKYSTSTAIVNADNSTIEESRRFTRVVNTNFIGVPGVFKYRLGKKQRFYVLGGGYTAFALHSKIDAYYISTKSFYSPEGDLQQKTESLSRPGKVYYHIVDVGLVVGGGIELPLNNKWSVGIDGRVNVGLVNVPANFSKYGYLSFSQTSKNINMETGIKIFYAL